MATEKRNSIKRKPLHGGNAVLPALDRSVVVSVGDISPTPSTPNASQLESRASVGRSFSMASADSATSTASFRTSSEYGHAIESRPSLDRTPEVSAHAPDTSPRPDEPSQKGPTAFNPSPNASTYANEPSDAAPPALPVRHSVPAHASYCCECRELIPFDFYYRCTLCSVDICKTCHMNRKHASSHLSKIRMMQAIEHMPNMERQEQLCGSCQSLRHSLFACQDCEWARCLNCQPSLELHDVFEHEHWSFKIVQPPGFNVVSAPKATCPCANDKTAWSHCDACTSMISGSDSVQLCRQCVFEFDNSIGICSRCQPFSCSWHDSAKNALTLSVEIVAEASGSKPIKCADCPCRFRDILDLDFVRHVKHNRYVLQLTSAQLQAINKVTVIGCLRKTIQHEAPTSPGHTRSTQSPQSTSSASPIRCAPLKQYLPPQRAVAPKQDASVVPPRPTPQPQHAPSMPPRPAAPQHPISPQHPVSPQQPVSPQHPISPQHPASPQHPVSPQNPVSPQQPSTPPQPVLPQRPSLPQYLSILQKPVFSTPPQQSTLPKKKISKREVFKIGMKVVNTLVRVDNAWDNFNGTGNGGSGGGGDFTSFLPDTSAMDAVDLSSLDMGSPDMSSPGVDSVDMGALDATSPDLDSASLSGPDLSSPVADSSYTDMSNMGMPDMGSPVGDTFSVPDTSSPTLEPSNVNVPDMGVPGQDATSYMAGVPDMDPSTYMAGIPGVDPNSYMGGGPDLGLANLCALGMASMQMDSSYMDPANVDPTAVNLAPSSPPDLISFDDLSGDDDCALMNATC